MLQLRDDAPLAEQEPERRLRVAVVTETWPPEVNGVAMTVHRLVEWLGRRHRVTLIRVRQSHQDRGTAILGISTLLLPSVPLPRYHELRMGLPSVGRLKNLWRAKRPDVVHVITEGPLGWSRGPCGQRPRHSGRQRLPYQFSSIHGPLWPGAVQVVALRYLRTLHNRTLLTLVPTRTLAEDMLRQGFERVDVLARGVDTELFHPRYRRSELRASWGAGPNDPVLLMVSRIAPEKNLPLALQAYERARERVPGTRMVVVGDGPARAATAATHPGVHFAGMQTGRALADHYASADIFVFPSLSETFGNVTLEAMASGLAVVAFRLRGGPGTYRRRPQRADRRLHRRSGIRRSRRRAGQ
jgi:glycosyltransferase involved in cell wall biosynthesis